MKLTCKYLKVAAYTLLGLVVDVLRRVFGLAIPVER